MALKIQKEYEMRFHDNFYTNVYLCTLNYPPQETFNSVFKKDMFVKNNKVGFQQVVYYLLEILDKDVLKQKISTWPLYDIRSENEYRNEVMKYVNELNTIYEDANIPNIATSHLITPGGFRFIKFIFKLSQFVLYQHLQRNICPTMLLPLQPSNLDDVTMEAIERVEKVASTINKSVNSVIKNFNQKFASIKVISHNIRNEIWIASDLNESYEGKLKLLKNVSKSKDSSTEISVDIFGTLNTLRLLKEKVERATVLNSYLENRPELTYNGELSCVVDPMRKIRIENNTLNLPNLLESFNLLLEQKCLEVKPTNKESLEKEIKRFSALNKKLESSFEGTNDVYSKSVKMLEKLRNDVKK
ncbi:hypothetical protein RI129_002392 [Pyrocoelia pectoralis]|uniref:HAUS augmin-like complex subunit 6 N-terminal domain-containing protein n=1 Tax=Pyrocoelia pectoralis TaxID=417401 RepID=A0AAN7VF82_9COLE